MLQQYRSKVFTLLYFAQFLEGGEIIQWPVVILWEYLIITSAYKKHYRIMHVHVAVPAMHRLKKQSLVRSRE